MDETIDVTLCLAKIERVGYVMGLATETMLKCREKSLVLGRRTLIMGILNVTPDSFSDGGAYSSVEAALSYAREMVEQGVDLIDIGGESTRPGAEKVALEEELKRVIPVIKALAGELDIPLSVDTYKSEVARQALDAGAHLINDVWGLKQDPEMASLAASYECPIILMHNRKERDYNNFLPDVIADLQGSIHLAHAAGIANHRILIDPGMGFAKDYKQNLFLMKHLREITLLGYPVVLGTSRKSMIRTTLAGLPADDVMEGTAATVAWGIAQGCQIMRVHDVKAMKRVAAMMDAMLQAELQ